MKIWGQSITPKRERARAEMCVVSREVRGQARPRLRKALWAVEKRLILFKGNGKRFLQVSGSFCFMSVKDHSASSTENRLKKGKTGSRRLFVVF